MITASDIVTRARRDLNDEGATKRWTDEDLLDCLNDAVSATLMLRPDLSSELRTVPLAANSSRQAVPSEAFQLLSLIRNMGSDGNTPGAPISLVSRDALEDANQTWHTARAVNEIDHYVVDDRWPTVYYVAPIPSADVHIEMAVAVPLAAVTELAGTIDLPATLSEPLREYVMHRAYGKNKSDAMDIQQSTAHLQTYYVMMGEESKARALASPENNEEGGNG